ncbi:MAG: Cell division protein FtsK [Myxococcaceae bacterium]|nr:Cell division protein FtsK [Myxococcaceae bacterium]
MSLRLSLFQPCRRLLGSSLAHSAPVRAQRPRRGAWPCLLLAVLLQVSALGRAAAESPYDQKQRALAQRAIAHGREPLGALDLLELLRQGDRADPAVTRELFDKLAKTRSLGAEQRVLAARASAIWARRAGDLAGSAKVYDQLGYLRKFRVIGPFDNEGKQGFDRELGPERERLSAVKLDAQYPGRERPVRWRKLPEIVQNGQVDFDALLRPIENVCALAETTLSFDKAQPITLWLGGGGATKLYFNGVEVIRDAAYRGFGYDRSVASVDAAAGNNRLLVKSCTTSGPFSFAVRVGDARGEPLVVAQDADNLDPVRQTPETLAAEAKAASPKQTGMLSVLAQLERAAAVERPSAAALENLARFLWYSSADDPAVRRAHQLAVRAAELGPTPARFLMASSLADERYEKMRLLQKALALAPNDADVQIANARILSTGPAGERALRALDGAPKEGAAGLDVLEARIGFLRQLGLRDTAKAAIAEALKRAPRCEALLELAAELASEDTRKDEQLRISRELVALRYDHYPSRRALTEAAIAAGKDVEALEQLDAIRALYPGSEKRALYLADLYDALGRDDLELATLKHALEIVPESEVLWVRQGRALLRGQRTEAATESLRRALALAPQDAATRELLEQIVPEQRLDEGYAIERDKLLARRVKSAEFPSTILQDLNVTTVFENGLGSRFVQFAAQVHDAEGARRLRARSIQFDPETQRVDVRLARVYRADGRVLEATETYEEQLGEPWYRVYYDTRALVVVFPDLEPGDSVELRYRVDDVAPRNLYADYFGDLHLFAGAEPRVDVEYVLITPAARKFYVNKPKLELETREELKGAQRIQHFHAKNLPALRSEPNMPGVTETVPYLHISTYESWEKVGRWWWGLVHDQLYADENLKKVVADLKRGSKSEAELVQRIYGWVVTNTRYVALEFGIHGFLPYRVPEIVRRGFGDCKDKASLIYTMLREAGVDARLVLVRTDQNGAIDTEPASLSVFDHAIAYVPSLDLFLDGTAEHSGTRELPAGDQGIMVLVVGEKTVELKTTPILPPETNLRTRKLNISLNDDGAGSLSAEEQIAGNDAARYRNTFQAVGTQKDRLQRQLSSSYPGLSLEQHSFSNLGDIEQPVTLKYSLTAPLMARPEGSELRISASGLGDLLRELASMPARKYTLDLGVPRAYREERTVRAPTGYVVRAAPAGGEVKSRFGSLTVKNEQRADSVVSRTAFTLGVKRVEPKDYGEFRRFVEQADGLVRQRISFSKESK